MKSKSETEALLQLKSPKFVESEDDSSQEDKDDFKSEGPQTDWEVFWQALSKEERTVMLKRHPKPDIDAA